MTDEQIEKALECCSVPDGCDECPYSQDTQRCSERMPADALALVKRQREEIARVKAEHIRCRDCKHSESCVVQIHTYSEEIAAELHFSDPNNFYCAFAKMKGGEE